MADSVFDSQNNAKGRKMKAIHIIVMAILFCVLAFSCNAGQVYEISAIETLPVVETVHRNIVETLFLARVDSAEMKIDGVLNESYWKITPRIGPLSRVKSANGEYKGNKADDTYVKMFCDDKNLYIAAILHESDMSKLHESLKTRDAPLWADDCFELFVDPTGLRKEYAHLIVNPAGVVFDAWIKKGANGKKNTDTTWNPSWKRAVKKHADKWIVEIALPLKMFPYAASDFMAINLAREQARNSGLACWANVNELFHDIENYKLVSLKKTSVVPSKIKIDSFVVGKNIAFGEFKNLTDKPVSGKLFIKINNKRIASADMELAPRQVKKVDLKFNLGKEDFGEFLQLGLDSNSAEVIIAGMQMPRVKLIDLRVLTGLVCLNQKVKLKVSVNVSAEKLQKQKASLKIYHKGQLQKSIQIAPLKANNFLLTLPTTGLGVGKCNVVLEIEGEVSHRVNFEIIPGPFD